MKHSVLTIFGCLTASLLTAAPVFSAPKEQLPQGAKVTALATQPQTISLTNKYAYAQVLVEATLENGDRIDATRIAEAAVSGELADVSPTMVVRPKTDGQGKVT